VMERLFLITIALVGVPDRTTLNRWSVMRSLVYGACGM
jgi:hypothetical protein